MERSESISALAGALSKAHGEFKKVTKDAENPYFKSSYADLATLIDATKEGLSKNGLAVIQSPGKITEAGRVSVTTMLAHSSGEWLRDDLEMPVTKADAQGLGSAITYARRYAYQSMLNIAGEEDDDGNAAVGRSQKDRQSKSTETGPGTINPAQARAFWSAVKQGGKTQEQVKTWFKTLKIAGTEEMQKSDLDMSIKWAVGREEDLTGTLKKSVEATGHNFSKLFAAAREHGVSEDDVRQMGHETYKVNSLKELTAPQFAALLEWVENLEIA